MLGLKATQRNKGCALIIPRDSEMSQLETVLRSILLSPHQTDGDFQLNEIKHALLFEVQSSTKNKTKTALLLQGFLLEPVIFGRCILVHAIAYLDTSMFGGKTLLTINRSKLKIPGRAREKSD